MMATVPHVTSGSGLRKFQSDGFLSDGVYKRCVFPYFLNVTLDFALFLRVDFLRGKLLKILMPI
jgi:hypothetical protein